MLTRDVGGNLSKGCLAETFGRAGSHWDQVRGSWMEVGEHVVRLVPQFGHRAPWARHIDTWVGRLDALVADL